MFTVHNTGVFDSLNRVQKGRIIPLTISVQKTVYTATAANTWETDPDRAIDNFVYNSTA